MRNLIAGSNFYRLHEAGMLKQPPAAWDHGAVRTGGRLRRMDGGLHTIRDFVNRYLRFDPILTPNLAVRVR
jgi:hypothetical protein